MDDKEIIDFTVKMTLLENKKKGVSQYLVRIPKDIEDFLNIQKGDKFRFIIDVKIPKNKSVKTFEIIKGDNDGRKNTKEKTE
jgi:hypothetical protein